MIATALQILDATNKTIYSEDIMGLAGELHSRRNELDDETFAKYLYMYSAALSAKVADKVALACLGENDYNAMTDEVIAMDDLTDDILREDRENGK
jgi:inosine-uridine nucleoside N-ribohydrolase